MQAPPPPMGYYPPPMGPPFMGPPPQDNTTLYLFAAVLGFIAMVYLFNKPLLYKFVPSLNPDAKKETGSDSDSKETDSKSKKKSSDSEQDAGSDDGSDSPSPAPPSGKKSSQSTLTPASIDEPEESGDVTSPVDKIDYIQPDTTCKVNQYMPNPTGKVTGTKTIGERNKRRDFVKKYCPSTCNVVLADSICARNGQFWNAQLIGTYNKDNTATNKYVERPNLNN